MSSGCKLVFIYWECLVVIADCKFPALRLLLLTVIIFTTYDSASLAPAEETVVSFFSISHNYK